jgi:hypothetical protein
MCKALGLLRKLKLSELGLLRKLKLSEQQGEEVIILYERE